MMDLKNELIPVTAKLPLRKERMKFVPAEFIAYKTCFIQGTLKDGDGHISIKFWLIGFLNFSAN